MHRPPFTGKQLLELDLLHAGEAIAGQKLIIALQRLVITGVGTAGRDTTRAGKLLDVMEHHLVQLNGWRQQLLDKLDR